MDGQQYNTKLMVFVGFWIVLMVVCCYAENESDGTYAEIGLSIGNTNWRAAVMVNGSLEWIVDRNGNVDHPSFENINKIIVSNYKIIKSRDGYLLESNNNIFERNGTVYCKVKLDDEIEKEMTPEEIYSDILHDVKELAFQYLKRNITNIFLSVPAYFKQTQEDYIIRNAASKHNLTIVRSVRDPIMAVLAQDHFQKINNNYTNDSNDERTFLVVDLGIRSLALNIVNDDFGFYEILASESYGQLGTERFHMKLRELFVKEFKKQHLLNEQSNILENQQINELLLRQAEKSMISLSKENSVRVNIPSLFDGKDFTFELTREIFENQCQDLLEQIAASVFRLFNRSDVFAEEISQVILSGGGTLNPSIRSAIIDRYFKDGNVSNILQASTIGAALQAAVVYEPFQTVSLILAPFSLGIENSDSQLVKIIERGTVLPTVKKMVFSSERGFLDSVDFCIFAGDNIYEMEKNIQLGQLTLEGIELTEKGKSQIEVSFELSDSFILNVTATDLTTKVKSEKIISLEKLESNRELTNKLEQDATKDGEEKEIRKLLHTYNSPSVLHEEL